MFPKKKYFGTPPTPKGGPVLGVPELLLEDFKKSVFFANIYLFLWGNFWAKKKKKKKIEKFISPKMFPIKNK